MTTGEGVALDHHAGRTDHHTAATPATTPPDAGPVGATRVARRAVASHRAPRRHRPVRVAAAGGLVAVAAGIVIAVT
ncbi:hypothetical protein, partial [Streptacidiphilus anmyonensis]|uniref:hypothetical protein n=1 Tax=Streptacidiphilus anmyonensis TaxID=405782 RepID=UPI001F2A4207